LFPPPFFFQGRGPARAFFFLSQTPWFFFPNRGGGGVLWGAAFSILPFISSFSPRRVFGEKVAKPFFPFFPQARIPRGGGHLGCKQTLSVSTQFHPKKPTICPPRGLVIQRFSPDFFLQLLFGWGVIAAFLRQQLINFFFSPQPSSPALVPFFPNVPLSGQRCPFPRKVPPPPLITFSSHFSFFPLRFFSC